MSSNIYGPMAVLLISIDRMPFLAPTLDNADLLFALVINTRFLSAPRRGEDTNSKLEKCARMKKYTNK